MCSVCAYAVVIGTQLIIYVSQLPTSGEFSEILIIPINVIEKKNFRPNSDGRKSLFTAYTHSISLPIVVTCQQSLPAFIYILFSL